MVAVGSRYRQLRRDVGAVLDGLRGRTPPPLVRRKPGRRTWADARSGTERALRSLQVVDRITETAEAVSLILEDPSGAELAFVPGQFFTVQVDIDGRSHRRAYSASSDCGDRSRVRLTIKRVTGGLVSNHINDHVRVGDRLRVLGPSGSFSCTPEADRERHVVLIGGGSGITPLMAIARAVLEREPRSRVSLLYGNRSPADIIFAGELDQLASRHGDRFAIRHVLERTPSGWTGGAGRLDREVAGRELSELGAGGDESDYYICGPEPMMAAVREILLARGIVRARIREERFTSPHLRTRPNEVQTAQQAIIRAGERPREVTVEAGQTLLDAGLGAGVAMKFSCAMGGCGACKVRLVSGEVTMEEPSCLTAGERDQGYVLACVSRPRTAVELELDGDRA